MDRYGKRLILVAVMLALAALSASLPVAGKKQPDKPDQPDEIEAQQLSAALTEPPVQAGFFVVLRTEAGRRVSLYARSGELLQTVTADETGCATFSSVPPGRYRVASDGCGGEFCLWENASVTALSGTLWDDGELLHLSDVPTVRLCLHLHTTAEQTGRVVTVTVTSISGQSEQRSFVAGSPGVSTVEFACLPPGEYRVSVSGDVVRYITLTSDPVQEIVL